MKYILNKYLVLFLVVFCIAGCEKDSKNGNKEVREFIVAFEEQSIAYAKIIDSEKLSLVFSELALVDGSIEVEVVTSKADYGVDFKTIPQSVNGLMVIPFAKGDRRVSFDFVNLIYPFDRSDKTIEFKIKKINYSGKQSAIQGYDVMIVSFDTALGGVLEPQIGGPAQPKQVYVDLGGKAMYSVQRDSWDLAFYNGSEFRVKLNGSIYMAAGSINSLDIDLLREGDFTDLKKVVQIGTFDPANVNYIDFPSGELKRTAIGEIKDVDASNKVYLVNLGFVPGSNKVAAGSVDIAGAQRGWKKVRILLSNNGYLLQYADLNANTHKEVFIPKVAGANFQNFSFNTESIVEVEPSKSKWDLNFTVFTNTVDQNGDPKGSYGFSDFIVVNRYGGTEAYRLEMPEGDKKYYKNFSLSDVNPTLFSSDLRSIGGTWRDVANNKTLFKNIFYVVKDTKGNFYKMRVLSFMNDKGERGYPKFEYSLLR